MAILLRLTKRATWSGAPPDESRRDDARVTFRRREQDTDGISVYEVETDAERSVVVAAVACMRRNDNPVDFLEIPREVAEQYGAVDRSPGTTPLARANELRRCLDWPEDTLRRLADDLFERSAVAQRYLPASVRQAVCALDVDPTVSQDVREFIERQKAKRPKT